MIKQHLKYLIWKFLWHILPQSFLYKLSHYKSHLLHGNHRYWANLKNPQTFNEKIIWLKRNHRFDLGPVIADKVAVRNYVKGKVGEEILIPQIDVYNSADELNFNELPKQCVLKPNHGSGWVIIKKGNEPIKELELYRKKLQQWLNWNAYYMLGEWQYKNISRKIVCEPYVQEIDNLVDYKFFCFKGNPRFIQIDTGRHSNHKRLFKNMYWETMSLSLQYPLSDENVPKPENLKEMIMISRKLSRPFIFSRVDLYNVSGKIYFGEITLHLEAGNGVFGSYEQDLKLGKLLDLSTLQN